MCDKRILVVDDNKTALLLLEHALKKQRPDYQVVSVNNGYDALARLQTQPFDLLVTDYNMPGMNGLDLAQAVRRIWPDIPIVLMTVHNTLEIRAEARRRRLNLDVYISKPVTSTQLEATFKHLEAYKGTGMADKRY
jgi:CheY-like chemotaxis protein